MVRGSSAISRSARTTQTMQYIIPPAQSIYMHLYARHQCEGRLRHGLHGNTGAFRSQPNLQLLELHVSIAPPVVLFRLHEADRPDCYHRTRLRGWVSDPTYYSQPRNYTYSQFLSGPGYLPGRSSTIELRSREAVAQTNHFPQAF
jgi:hypothetical protein